MRRVVGCLIRKKASNHVIGWKTINRITHEGKPGCFLIGNFKRPVQMKAIRFVGLAEDMAVFIKCVNPESRGLQCQYMWVNVNL
jgi:hypothetical protein